MIVEKTGDIFATTAQVIAHGCNCLGSMGAGIAAEIRKRYAVAFDEYAVACADRSFRPGDVQLVRCEPHWILNMATQASYGRPIWRGGGMWASTDWIEACLRRVDELAAEFGIESVAFPRVGCRHGGLFWDAEDHARKQRLHGDANVPQMAGGFVKDVFDRVFSSSSFLVELWMYPAAPGGSHE